ncbi:MAG: oxidoreductase [Parvibaculum sp.]|nr:oxidoreductase [Parvibaculum sp.]
METSLKGRVALVTGGSRGIGRAISLTLAKAGADIAINYRRDDKAAEEVAAEVRKLGRRAEIYSASVDDGDQAAALVASVLKDFGSIGVLINNAGIASRGQTVADTDPAELERVVRVHALAPHRLSQLVLPTMREEERGDIVMISSVATLSNGPNGAPYNMGKAAMEALALTLAKEERKHGIRTNIVSPSLTVTEMGTRLVKARSGADIHDLDATSPFGRVSVPEDVAAAVLFFVSNANPYCNGQKLNVDGGGA